MSEVSHSACLGEHSSLVHELRLNPTALGEHNISVTADIDSEYPSVCGPESIMNARYSIIIFSFGVSNFIVLCLCCFFRDGLTKKIIIKPEGFPEEITNSIFVCLKGRIGIY